MFGLRSVAGFAVDMHVFSALLCIGNVGVTCLAGIVSGIVYLPGGNFSDGVCPVVSISAKTLGDNVSSDQQKEKKREGEKSSETK